jgi:hypothetical protein
VAHWLVQSNPAKWRVREFFADGNQLESWSITRYRDQIQEGDDVALWLAGPEAGVVALGVVTGDVEDVLGDDDPYWTDPADAQAVRMRMPLRLTEVFLDAPITREELRHDRRFAGATILSQPFAGNPFLLTDEEWAAILDHHRDQPPASSTLDARSHLASLIGKTIQTLNGAPNTVLRLEGDEVIVATTRSPQGQPVPIAWVQAALDRLLRDGEVEISVASVGYRSAFVGAALAALPGARTARNPLRVLLPASPGTGRRSPVEGSRRRSRSWRRPSGPGRVASGGRRRRRFVVPSSFTRCRRRSSTTPGRAGVSRTSRPSALTTCTVSRMIASCALR